MRDDNIGKATARADVEPLSEKCKEVQEAGKRLTDSLGLPEPPEIRETAPKDENLILCRLETIGQTLDYAARAMMNAGTFIQAMRERL